MTLAERLALPDLADLPDWQVADILNTPDQSLGTKRVDVLSSDVRGLLLGTGEWGAIKLLSRMTPSEQVPAQAIVAAIIAIDTLELTTTIEASKPQYYAAVEALVAGLQSANVISSGTGAALLAMADQPMSWAEINNIPVDARMIGLARGGV